MMACNEPHGIDIITPGASTVAMFKTLILMVLEDFSSSQTERQVNALNYVMPLYPPNLLCLQVLNPQKARRALRHGSIGFMKLDTIHQIIQSQKYNYFSKQKKENETK